MRIELLKATIEQKPMLANLLELYAYDFTEFFDFDIGQNGYYGYENLSLYWSDPNRYPFLIYVEGQLAGFILLQKGSPISEEKDVFDVAEFFIMKKYRRKNIGSTVARGVWGYFKGSWQVRVLLKNKRAHAFWSKTIAQFAKRSVVPTEIEIKKERWLVYRFHS